MPRKFNPDTLLIPASGQLDVAVPGSAAGLHIRTFAARGDGKPNRIWFIRGRVRKPKGIQPIEPGMAERGYVAIATAVDASRTGQKPPKPKQPGALFIRLGAVGELNYADAEAEAHRIRRQLRDGINPLTERVATMRANAAKNITVGQLVAEHLADPRILKRLRPATLRNRKWVLNTGLASLHDTPLVSLSSRDIESVRPANRNTEATILGPLRALLTDAVERGYIERAPKIKIARPEGNASPLVQFIEGQPADFSELIAVLHCLPALPAPWPGIYRFAILTGARPSDVLGNAWPEFDLTPKVAWWTLPAGRSKIKRMCRRPLSEAAASILRDAGPQPMGLVWPSRRGTILSSSDENRTLSALLAIRGFKSGFSLGRCRDTVASWLELQDASERSMALILNHAPPARTTRQRHYTQISAEAAARRLLERWADTVADAEAGRPTGDIISLAERSRA